MINWRPETKEELTLILKIAKRATKINPQINLVNLEMDITAVHCNGNKLKLQELLDTDSENFFHDVFGIMKFINRKTGKLLDSFSPRYSV